MSSFAVSSRCSEKNITATKAFLKKVVESERPRLTTLKDLFSHAEFFFKLPDYDGSMLVWQKDQTTASARLILEKILKIVQAMDTKNFEKEIPGAFADLIIKEGRGPVLWPLRVALSGLKASPDPMEIMSVLGKQGTEERVKNAIAKLNTLV